MKTITPSQLQQLLDADTGVSVLDVRTPMEFTEVHVARAENVPLDELDPEALLGAGRVVKGGPVYLLCRSGGRASKAADKFSRAGFDGGVVVEGGTQAWIEAGLPVVRGEVKVMSLERQVRIAAGSLVVLGVVLAAAVHPYFIAISAFVGCGLIFAGVSDWCGMGLLLAKMPWNARK